jgi:MFS family permease
VTRSNGQFPTAKRSTIATLGVGSWQLGIVGVSFLLLSVVWTWPLATRLTTRIPHDPGDPILNTWILWWNAQAIPFTDKWWNAPAFFPMRDALALSEHLAGLAPISTPLLLAGVSPLGVYNIVLILTFALSGFFAYLLVFRLTGSRLAAVCGGLAYGFSPYRAGQLGHLQVLASFWMPLALLALHEYVGGGRRRWLIVFAVAWLLQALSNGYYLLFFPVLIALWLLWFVRWRTSPGIGLRLAVAWAVASLPLIPVLLKYRAVHGALGLSRSLDENRSFSADLASFVHAGPLVRFWPFMEARSSEDHLFPGVTAVALLTIGGIAAIVGSRGGVRQAFAARSPFLFYMAAKVVMLALAFGPAPDGAGVAALGYPYTLLATLPGFSSLRVPARFAMLGTLCLAVGIGLVVGRLAPANRERRALFGALVVAGLLADGWMNAMPLFPPPSRVALPNVPNAVVVELPPAETNVGVTSMYRSMFHRRPVASGYSGHLPLHTLILSSALHRGDPSVLTLLARDNPLIIVVDERLDDDGALTALVRDLPGVQRHTVTGAGQVYILPQAPPSRVAEPGTEWPSIEQVEQSTRRIDLGAVRIVRTIGFELYHHYHDLQTRMTFETSLDGKTWTTVWDDWTGALALAAVLRNAQVAPVRITLPDVSARYIRFGPAPEWLWKEIRFYGA